MSSPDKSAALARLLSRNTTKSSKRRDETRSDKPGERRKSFQFASTTDGQALNRIREGLNWSSDVEGSSSSRSRPWSAAAFVHALHPVASFTPFRYGKLSDLDMHIAGAIERRDTHRDLLAETMERMAKHNARLKMEAQRLRLESQDRAARTIQIYWRLYRERLIEQRKEERRKRSTWMESVRRRPLREGSDSSEDWEDEEEEEEGGEGGEGRGGKSGKGRKKGSGNDDKKKHRKKAKKKAESNAASDPRKARPRRKSKRKGAGPAGVAGEGGAGEGNGADQLDEGERELEEQELQWQRIKARVLRESEIAEMRARGRGGEQRIGSTGTLETLDESFVE
ncbi:hypothetical protein Agub_g8059, partial [Astrephomene gubernaculifera]